MTDATLYPKIKAFSDELREAGYSHLIIYDSTNTQNEVRFDENPRKLYSYGVVCAAGLGFHDIMLNSIRKMFTPIKGGANIPFHSLEALVKELGAMQ